MILWIFALCLMAVLALIGYYQGAIRVAFSLVGLLLATLLAMPLSFLGRVLLPIFGINHPVWLAFTAPLLGYLLILVIFKSLGLVVHQKVDTYYKYKDSDTRRMLFERVNQRLGICLGLANAVVYFLLLSVVAYVVGYFTIQVASSPKDSMMLKLFNTVGEALQATKMDKAVAVFVPAKPFYYDAVDIIGDVFHAPLLQSRLATYPPFLALADKQEFKELGSQKFVEFCQTGPSFGELKEHERVKPLLSDVEIYTNIVGLVNGDLQDLKTYVETGKSPKFDDEKILGRWSYNHQSSVVLAKKAKPNMSTAESRYIRGILTLKSNATFTASVDSKAVLKLPTKPNSVQTLQGSWKNVSSDHYTLVMSEEGKTVEIPAKIEGGKLVVTKDAFKLVFEK